VRPRRLAFGAAIDIAGQGQEIGAAIPVQPEAGLRPRPAVMGRYAGGGIERALVEILEIDAIVDLVGERAAILQGDAAVLIARLQDRDAPGGVGSLASDDVDYAIDGVGAPQGAAGPTDHFDALHI